MQAQREASQQMEPDTHMKLGRRDDAAIRIQSANSPEWEVFAMRPRRSVALLALWLAGGAAAMAQEPGTANPVFTRQAITAALSRATATIVAS